MLIRRFFKIGTTGVHKCLCGRYFPTKRSLSSSTETAKSDAKAPDRPAESSSAAEPALLPPLESQSVVKGMVVNKIDKKMLIFPQFYDSEDVSYLEAFAQEIDNFMARTDPSDVDRLQEIPETLIQGLKDRGVYGTLVPKQFNGLDLKWKEYTRIQECLSHDWSVYTTISVHNDLVTRAITDFGSESQKSKYLPDLASGKITGAFCLCEEASGHDIAGIQSICTASSVPGYLELSGTKSWVTNGKNADVYVVFAKTKSQPDQQGPLYTSAYLIDKRGLTGGDIVALERQTTTGLKGAEFWEMEFRNVRIPRSAILGQELKGFELAQKILDSSRFAFGAAVVGFLKRLIGTVAKHCIDTKRFDQPLSSISSIKKRVGEMAQSIHALETMTYYLAGFLDEEQGLEKDFSIEFAIVNRFAKSALNKGIFNAMQIVGAASVGSQHDFERLLRDCATLTSFMTHPDVLAEKIAMDCLATWAKVWNERLSEIRRPKYFPRTYSNKRFREKYTIENPKYTHYINETCHPSLEDACRVLETTMAHFEVSFSRVLENFGKAVENESYILDRLADTMTLLFAMTTLISRTSRSYSIGLKYSDHELIWTHTFCLDARRQIQHMMDDLLNLDTVGMEDDLKQRVSGVIFDQKGYKLCNPLQRNW